MQARWRSRRGPGRNLTWADARRDGRLRGSHPAGSEPMERLLLLDGNGLIYRGYFALIDQPLTTSKGELVTAVFGFTNIVLRAIQDCEAGPRRGRVRPAQADLPPRPLRRVQGDPDADAGRHARPDPEGARGRQGARDPGLRAGGVRGGRRDRHARRARRRPRASRSSSSPATWTCSSSSRSGRTSWSRSAAASRTRSATTCAKIEERWGLRPDQMLDYKALKGDSTDNIPGIPGVGEKTASKLVATWGTLDELYAHLDEVTPGEAAGAADRVPRPGAREPRADAPRARRGPPARHVAAGGWGTTTARRSSACSASTSSGR